MECATTTTTTTRMPGYPHPDHWFPRKQGQTASSSRFMLRRWPACSISPGTVRLGRIFVATSAGFCVDRAYPIRPPTPACARGTQSAGCPGPLCGCVWVTQSLNSCRPSSGAFESSLERGFHSNGSMLASGDLPSALPISCARYGSLPPLVVPQESHSRSGRPTHGSFPSAVVRFSPLPSLLLFASAGLNSNDAFIEPENTLYRYVMRMPHGRIPSIPPRPGWR